jgi:hypothetical protein
MLSSGAGTAGLRPTLPSRWRRVRLPAGRAGVRIMQVEYVTGELYKPVNNTLRISAGVFFRW